MTEADLVHAQAEMLERLGITPYLVNQTRSKTKSFTTPGFADMVFFAPGRIVFNETKLDYNEPSEAQLGFQRNVLKGGGIYVVTHSTEELLFVGGTLGIWKER